jgi:hypothetical protein
MKSGSWSSFQSALSPEARAGGEPDEPEPEPPPVPITVLLACNGERVPEGAVGFLDIHEDIQGHDVLTFTCPACGRSHESKRFA